MNAAMPVEFAVLGRQPLCSRKVRWGWGGEGVRCTLMMQQGNDRDRLREPAVARAAE